MNIIIDFKNVKDKQSLYVYLRNVFSEFEFYGSNLDALMEVLMCLKNVKIVLRGVKELSEVLDQYASKVIDTFKLADSENRLLNVIIEEV